MAKRKTKKLNQQVAASLDRKKAMQRLRKLAKAAKRRLEKGR